VLRIEVIRGPGASVWGANAVNGVINVITRKSAETQGGLLAAGAGNLEQGFATMQYGGNLGKSTDYRIFAKYLNHISFPGLNGGDGGDGWRMLRGGFRSDSVLSAKTTLTFQGDIYTGREGNPISEFLFPPGPLSQNIELLANLSGGFFQGVWNHVSSPHSNTSIETYYDAYKRNDKLHDDRKTIDFDFQNNFSGWRRQKIVWGATYRYSTSQSAGSYGVSFDPPGLATQLFGSFLQDEVAIVPNHLLMTFGAKLEHNYYTGFSIMPSARAAWTPAKSRTLWAAISKTERTPAELDASLRGDAGEIPGPGGVPILLILYGNPHVLNEGSIAYETGYRTMVGEKLSADLAAYYNNYSRQNTDEPQAPFFVATPSPHLVLPLLTENMMHGETHGMEVEANWKVADRCTLSSGYAFEQIHMHLAPTSHDTDSVSEAQRSSPVNSVQLRLHLALLPGLTVDTTGYFVGRLTDPVESSYTRLDSQLSWRLGESINLGIVGQDLLKDRHQEFVDPTGSVNTTLVKRSAYAKAEWRF
jgi:iron complex outermembrane receptor protein